MSKTIHISPELLKVGKTKKNKPVKFKPILTSKMIKKTLINRIKENRKKKDIPVETNLNLNDFQESEKFLTEILNKKEKTIKNYHPLNNYSEIAPISKNVENILFKPTNQTNMKLNYKIDSESPHGCLKNGIKPCFRSYKKFTQSSKPIEYIVEHKPYTDKDIVKGIIESEINKAKNGKIEFSKDLVNKYRVDEKPLLITDEDINIDFDSLPTKPEIESLEILESPLEILEFPLEIPLEKESTDFSIKIPEINLESSQEVEEIEPQDPIQIKRIIKRKYTLGKNKNKVGVLMKNKKSKKNIIDYTKELRKIPNEDIKKKLRECGLIKVGSTAPPEIVRKIFENMKMAGDIINEDKDILIHNLINQTE